MQKSESIKNIATALLNFHKEVANVERDSKGYNYKYASLENVLNTIKEPLANNGLTFTQLPVGNYGLTTILIHADSGEFIQSTSEIIPVKDDPQGRGSSITYSRRYHLVALLGLNVEDDDGATASGNSTNVNNSTSELPWLNEKDPLFKIAVQKLKNGETTIEKIKQNYKISKAILEKLNSA